MTHDSTRRRWTIAGLASMAIGAAAVVAGLAAPAAAHEGKEPAEVPETNSLSCADLAEKFGIEGVEWTESKIEAANLPGEGESETYELVAGDRTPGYEGDGPSVTIDMNMELKNFDWSSTVGIDAVYVKGGSMGSYFYGYQPEVAGYNEDNPGTVVGEGAESMGDVDLGTPPYGKPGKNPIKKILFCWDDEDSTSTTSSSTTSSSTTSTTEGSTTTTTESTTSTTADVNPGSSTTVGGGSDTPESTTTTLAVTPASGELPVTGSNGTTLLLLGGLALLAAGGAAVAGNKWLRGT
jgi:LPXTG-motif cell wall-anchored protein